MFFVAYDTHIWSQTDTVMQIVQEMVDFLVDVWEQEGLYYE